MKSFGKSSQTGQYICVALLQGKFNLYYLSFMEAANEKILCKELNQN